MKDIRDRQRYAASTSGCPYPKPETRNPKSRSSNRDTANYMRVLRLGRRQHRQTHDRFVQVYPAKRGRERQHVMALYVNHKRDTANIGEGERDNRLRALTRMLHDMRVLRLGRRQHRQTHGRFVQVYPAQQDPKTVREELRDNRLRSLT